MFMGLSGNQYRPLSKDQIEAIHETSLRLLEKTGFGYEDGLDDVISELEAAGIKNDAVKRRLTFPREKIDAAVQKAPDQVILYSRNGKYDLDLGEHRVYLGTGGAAVRILDLESGTARPTTLKDLYQLGRLADYLDNIHFFLRPCVPNDIPPEAYDSNVAYSCLKSTGKHVMVGVNDVNGMIQAHRIASLVAGGDEKLREKPFISMTSGYCISPLKLCSEPMRIILESAKRGIPVALSSAPMSGSNAPMTMAGTLAQVHAEQLAGITICQIVVPGSKSIYGAIPGMADLSSMRYVGGAIEHGMMNAAIHQMSNHINVPNYNSCGLTDSKLPDIQAGWEKAFTTMLVAMGGSNFIHHAAGMLESLMTVSYEQYVIDNEIIGYVCKAMKGIDVDPEHLALEVIDAVGPGGNYFTQGHTLQHLRSEFCYGFGLSDRSSREKWEDAGSKDARERAREITRQVLEKDEVSYIPDPVDKKIKEEFNILI